MAIAETPVSVGAGRSISDLLVGGAGTLIGLLLVGATATLSFLGPVVWTARPDLQDLSQALQQPSLEFPFGTDQFGRDVLARVMHGGRVSILVALTSAFLGMAWGVGLGVTAGVFGKRVELVLMRIVDALLALPGVVQAVILVAIMGRGVLPLIVALGVYTVPVFARVTFSGTRQIMVQPYIEAARSLGARQDRILWLHVLPNLSPQIVTLFTLRLGGIILLASGLSFFGLGVQSPAPEWGLMIADGRSYSWSHPHLIVAPGMLLFTVSLGFNLLGDALEGHFDPRVRSARRTSRRKAKEAADLRREGLAAPRPLSPAGAHLAGGAGRVAAPAVTSEAASSGALRTRD